MIRRRIDSTIEIWTINYINFPATRAQEDRDKEIEQIEAIPGSNGNFIVEAFKPAREGVEDERRMSDLISKSALKAVKFHPLPYTHIVPTDADAESYKWGWNDAIDAIIESAPTIEPKRGKWIYDKGLYRCTACNNVLTVAGWDIPEEQIYKSFKFCPYCGARMERSEE